MAVAAFRVAGTAIDRATLSRAPSAPREPAIAGPRAGNTGPPAVRWSRDATFTCCEGAFSQVPLSRGDESSSEETGHCSGRPARRRRQEELVDAGSHARRARRARPSHAGVPTWEEIVDQHSDRVYRLAYRLTGNRHDAEDLTQEVFVRVFRSLSTYTPGTFEGWIHRITTNLFLDQARRKQRIRFDALSDERADRLHSALPTPDTAYADQTFDDDVERALVDAAAGVPGRRRALRRRGPVLRGDRPDPRRQARHRPLPHPPRPRHAPRGAGPPRPRRRPHPLPRAGCRSASDLDARDRRRDRPPRPARQRAPRRPAVPGRRGARLGPRALLPPVPRRRRARGLGQDPAGRPCSSPAPTAPSHLKGSLLVQRHRSAGPTRPTTPAPADARRAAGVTSA